MIAKFDFDDLYVGMSHSFTRDLTSEIVNAFAGITEDFHPLHVDKEYAIDNGFEGPIAHGFLLTSFLSYSVGMKIPGEKAIILSQSSNYLKPAYIGEILNITCKITHLDKRFSTITLSYKITNKKSVTLVNGEIKVKIRKKP